MKKIAACSLALVLVAACHAREEIDVPSEAPSGVQAAPAEVERVPEVPAVAEATPEVSSFKVGGRPIALPSPATDMLEVGYDHRETMEVFVPASNRLVAAYVLKDDLPHLAEGGEDLGMSRYAMVEVLRRGESSDCGPSEFAEVAAEAREAFGDLMDSSMKEAEEEFNRRMKSLDLDQATIEIGKPVPLGRFFSKEDAYGLGMVVAYSMGSETSKMGMGIALIRVKEKLLFAYVYATYQDEQTVQWLRKTTEAWADAILAAN